MARVTVEDCLKNVKNRFELVILAAKRARQLMRGKEAKVEWDNDKSTVVALREIAAGYVDFDHHEEEPIQLHQPVQKPVEVADEDMDEGDDADNLGNELAHDDEADAEDKARSAGEE